MKMKAASLMLIAASASAPATAGVLDDACNGAQSTGLAQCTSEVRQTETGTNIFPWGVVDNEVIWAVYDEVDVRNVKVHNGFTGLFEDYRLILVKETGLRGASLTEAAATREAAGYGMASEPQQPDVVASPEDGTVEATSGVNRTSAEADANEGSVEATAPTGETVLIMPAGQ